MVAEKIGLVFPGTTKKHLITPSHQRNWKQKHGQKAFKRSSDEAKLRIICSHWWAQVEDSFASFPMKKETETATEGKLQVRTTTLN